MSIALLAGMTRRKLTRKERIEILTQARAAGAAGDTAHATELFASLGYSYVPFITN